jgi:hypothetical protein
LKFPQYVLAPQEFVNLLPKGLPLAAGVSEECFASGISDITS